MTCIHGRKPGECWCTMRSGNIGLINGQVVEFGRRVGFDADNRPIYDGTKIKRFIPHKELPLRGGKI